MQKNSFTEVKCVCLGDVRKIQLMPGRYQLRCPTGGYFEVTIEQVADIEWKITHEADDEHGNRLSVTQVRYFSDLSWWIQIFWIRLKGKEKRNENKRTNDEG